MPAWAVTFDMRLDVGAPDIVRAAARIEALASVIRGIPIPPGVQAAMDRLNILRAVRGTTGIEGTELSEEEVERIMDAPPGQRVLPPSREREEKEARNAEKVMRFVAECLGQEPAHPVTQDLIRRLHRLTTEGIRYERNEPGEYRQYPVRAGTYVPPRTGEEVRRLMAEFERWFNDGPPRDWPAPVRAAVAHFYVVSIHPFGDGNGRTARAVESFVLFQGGVNARGFYSLANYYYKNRPEYVSMLDHVRFESGGDLTPFVRFGLGGLVAELEMVHQEILAEVTVIAFRDYARQALLDAGKLGTKPGERMLSFLLALPGGRVPLADLRRGSHPLSQYYRGATPRTLRRDLNFLRGKGLVLIEEDHVRANLERMLDFTR